MSQEGEEVYLRNFGRGESWLPGWIVNRTSSVSFLIRGFDGQTFRWHQDYLCPRQGDGACGTNRSVAELPVDDSTVEAMPTESSSSEESSSLVSNSVHDTSTQALHPAVSSGISVQEYHPLCHRVLARQYRAQVYPQLSAIHRETGRP